MKKTIAIDMDDVIADTYGMKRKLYAEEFGVEFTDEELKGRDLQDFIPEHKGRIREYLYEDGFFRNLPVIKDSQEVIKALQEKYEIYIATAAMEFPKSLKEKHEWLQEHFPFISWHYIIMCGYKTVINTDYLIDDRAKNLVNFVGEPILYTSLHNTDETRFTRVNNWQEVANMLL